MLISDLEKIDIAMCFYAIKFYMPWCTKNILILSVIKMKMLSICKDAWKFDNYEFIHVVDHLMPLSTIRFYVICIGFNVSNAFAMIIAFLFFECQSPFILI